MRSASWITLVVGGLVAATPFFTFTSVAAFWGALVAGALIAVLAIFDLYEESTNQAERVGGAAITSVLAGLYLVGSVFLVSASMTYLWIVGVAGLIVIATSIYTVAEVRRLQGRAGDV